jgi:glycosyltransferase involved in cell wall biosynthesis
MKLSIITCTYNSEKYLPEAIWSITSQNSWLDYEHIFIDGMSIDSTCDLIKEYAASNPTINIVLEQRIPKGIYNAMNEWIKLATWDFILFLNSDDFLSKNIIAQYLAFVKENPNGDIYHAKFQQIYEDRIIGIFPKSIFLSKILFQLGFNTFIFHPTALIKRSLFTELWYYDESKKIASDLWFWFLCFSKNKKFIFFPEAVSNFRIHDNSMTSNPANKAREIDEVSFFRKKYLWKLCIFTDLISKFFIKIKFILSQK